MTLFGAYFYGGVSSPFLPWLLIALLNGLFYLSDRPFSVLGIFAANFTGFLAFWYAAGSLPDRVPMERMSVVGLVSVASATLYMAWVAIYYGLLLASESALQREVNCVIAILPNAFCAPRMRPRRRTRTNRSFSRR